MVEQLTRLVSASFLTKDEVNIPKTDVTSPKLAEVLGFLFAIMGGIALIIIIIGGIKFILSQGNPEATAKARNTIIYAAVGLAVAIGGFSIVSFVVGKL